MQELRSRKLTAVLNVGPAVAPPWATVPEGTSLNGLGPNYPDSTHFLNYGAFVKAFVNHMKNDLKISDSVWQIGNEPNVYKENWNSTASPKLYTLYLKSAYTQIKKVFPGSTVLTAGMGGNRGNDQVAGNLTGPQFIKGVYDAGGKGYFDAISYHPYEHAYDLTRPNGWTEMLEVRNTMVAYGDKDKKIWATEVGEPAAALGSGNVGEQAQADLLTDAYTRFRQYSWAGPMFYYQLRNRPVPDSVNTPIASTYGLLRIDNSKKPAFDAFVNVNRF